MGSIMERTSNINFLLSLLAFCFLSSAENYFTISAQRSLNCNKYRSASEHKTFQSISHNNARLREAQKKISKEFSILLFFGLLFAASALLPVMCPIKFLSLYICLKIFAQALRIISIKMEFNATTAAKTKKRAASGSLTELFCVVYRCQARFCM